MPLRPGQRLLLDGAIGTELNRRGVDTSLPLWSTRALLEAEDILEQVHADYLAAGAEAITANTFRTQRRTLERANIAARTESLTARAVAIAKRARDAAEKHTGRRALVFGSVPPLEDCYDPASAPDYKTARNEQGEHIELLLRARVDAILIETMNTIAEALACAVEAQGRAPGRWILSCCLKHDASEPTLLSGEPVSDLIDSLNRHVKGGAAAARAIGCNCVPAPSVEENVKQLRATLRDDIPIIAYANVGKPDPDQGWTSTDAVDPEAYANYARTWITAGATIIGGCCGTSPETTRALRRVFAESIAPNSPARTPPDPA